jgi:aspartate-semialdehyde dehydrogenase
MSRVSQQQRIVIAGASSLLGGELKSLLEESRFAGWDLRLVDEDEAAGTLTEAGGEAALIQPLEEDAFRGARYAFLTGSRAFGTQCLGPARDAGATVIDYSHASLADPDATPWFPKIEALSRRSMAKGAHTFSVFSAGGMAVASLALGLRMRGLRRLVVVLHQPVSEVGRRGIEELEAQTSQLLSFQSVGSSVFGTQAAFNLLPSYGPESRLDLHGRLLELRAEVSAAIADSVEDAKISINLIHAPAFYGTTFSACVDVDKEVDATSLAAACRDAGFIVAASGDASTSNVSVAGETALHLSEPRQDSAQESCWWVWGAGDNLRVPAWSGVKLADLLEG